MTEPRPAGEIRVPPRRFGRGRIRLFRGVERACAWLGGRALYRRLHLAPGRFRVREERVEVRGLPAGLAGLSLVQLSDLHAGSFLGRGDLRAVVDEVRRLDPDLVVLTGDFITHHWSEVLPLVEDLAGARGRLGTFAVFGNHDYKDRQEGRIAGALEAHGVRFLRNDRVLLERDGERFALVGLEDLEEGREVDLERARRGLAGELELVLCHNPRGAPALARLGARLVLSGHTHGLQVDLPWLRTLGPQHPGLRVELGDTTLIVSRGLGVVGLPLRVGAPAELVVVRLVPAPEVALGR